MDMAGHGSGVVAVRCNPTLRQDMGLGSMGVRAKREEPV